MRVAATLRTVPLSLGLTSQLDAVEMKPLYFARVIIAANHIPIRDLAARTINGLVRINRALADAQPFSLALRLQIAQASFTVIFIRASYGLLFS